MRRERRRGFAGESDARPDRDETAALARERTMALLSEARM
jgi:hypothetical protein